MKNKILTLSLIFVMIVSAFPALTLTVYAADTEGWLWPVPARTPDHISSRFGPRTGGHHNGIDIAGNGHTVVATRSGVVVVALNCGHDAVRGNGCPYPCSRGNGTHVWLRHETPVGIFYSLYGHLRNGSVVISEGQRIAQGEAIGITGTTGWSTGYHLHFEVRQNGRRGTAVNTNPIQIDSRGIQYTSVRNPNIDMPTPPPTLEPTPSSVGAQIIPQVTSFTSNRTTGTTQDIFNFTATTNAPAYRVEILFSGDESGYGRGTMNMHGSNNGRTWTLNGNRLVAGTQMLMATAFTADGTGGGATVLIVTANDPAAPTDPRRNQIQNFTPFEPAQERFVTRDGAPTRERPYNDGRIIMSYNFGDSIRVTGVGTNSRGNRWYSVTGGWIYSGNLSTTNPFIVATPTPTPAPTLPPPPVPTPTPVPVTTPTPQTQTVTIHYNTNGGSGTPASHSATVIDNVATFWLTTTVPTRSGYVCTMDTIANSGNYSL
ncbi:MAG: M23 family metallopeptidase [Defluviitaleaceae bacterium]|nr:M23 family metallopeptidase [Defluviitaleaceae bacterium]